MDLVDPAVTQQSLMRLRDELIGKLAAKGQHVSPILTEVVFKINSCLFRQYPEVAEKAPE